MVGIRYQDYGLTIYDGVSHLKWLVGRFVDVNHYDLLAGSFILKSSWCTCSVVTLTSSAYSHNHCHDANQLDNFVIVGLILLVFLGQTLL